MLVGLRGVSAYLLKAIFLQKFDLQRNLKYTIKKRADFLRIQDQGMKVSSRFLVVFLLAKQSHNASQSDLSYGLTVSKRCGNAVIRTQIKRKLRESFYLLRKQAQAHEAYEIVIIAKPHTSEAEFRDLSQDLLGAVRRLKSYIHKNKERSHAE